MRPDPQILLSTLSSFSNCLQKLVDDSTTTISVSSSAAAGSSSSSAVNSSGARYGADSDSNAANTTTPSVNLIAENLQIKQEVVTVTRQLHGNTSVQTCKALSTYAKTLKSNGQLVQAEPYYVECALVRALLLGDMHVETSLAR